MLAKIIGREDVQNAFIFCNRKRDVDSLSKWLKSKGYDAFPMHGDMAQSSRTETLAKFKSGEITLLVCSDVAARGIDVQGVSHVFNYDVPVNPDDYVHRIGRTGRAGQNGHAWTLVTNHEDKQLDAVQKRIKKDIAQVDLGGGEHKGVKAPVREERTPKKASSQKKSPDKNPSGHKHPDKKPSDQRHSGKKPVDEVEDNNGGTGFGEEVPAFFKF
jgi:superfamily II DNA/RNA helicase